MNTENPTWCADFAVRPKRGLVGRTSSSQLPRLGVLVITAAACVCALIALVSDSGDAASVSKRRPRPTLTQARHCCSLCSLVTVAPYAARIAAPWRA